MNRRNRSFFLLDFSNLTFGFWQSHRSSIFGEGPATSMSNGGNLVLTQPITTAMSCDDVVRPTAKRRRSDNKSRDEQMSGDEGGTTIGNKEFENSKGESGFVNTSAELSISQVNELVDKVNSSCDALLTFIGNEKLPPGKLKLQNVVKSVNEAITKISCAYISKLSADALAGSCVNTLSQACKVIQRLTSDLADNRWGPGPPTMPSFAEVASRRGQAPFAKVSLGRGRPFSINSSDRAMIGSIDSADPAFPSSKETKAVLRKIIDPSKLKINVQSVSNGPHSSVRVEGGSLDALRKSGDRGKAGLEVKQETKINPRLIIHGIPVELSAERIVTCIVNQNLPEASCEDIKPVFLYPAGEKKFRSCVIETKPECRHELLQRSRVHIDWSACRVFDHVVVKQCLKCQRFGHIAKGCQNTACCGFCSSEHESRLCKSRNSLCCVNCATAGNTITAHAASDHAKCPLLRRQIEQKKKLIDYGEL